LSFHEYATFGSHEHCLSAAHGAPTWALKSLNGNRQSPGRVRGDLLARVDLVVVVDVEVHVRPIEDATGRRVDHVQVARPG